MTEPKILRVGTVSPVPSFDPREAMAAGPAQVAQLVFDQHVELLLPWGPRTYLWDPWGTGETIAAQLAGIGLVVDVVPLSTPRKALERAFRATTSSS